MLKSRALRSRAWVAPCTRASQPARVAARKVLALQINRAAGLDSAWKRQQEAEERQARLDDDIKQGAIIDIGDATTFDALIEKAGNSLVIVFAFRPSCGSCKDAALRFEQLHDEAHRAKARVVFVRHNVETDYGETSDWSRMHNVRAVPAFLFFDGGAMVRRLSLRDIRLLTGPKPYVQAAMAEDVRRLKATFLEVLLSRAPSARS